MNKKTKSTFLIDIAVLNTHNLAKTITSNRPDITFMNKRTKNTFLIDIAVPNTHNLAETLTNKQNKYQELANEICVMWKQNTAQVIPLVISSTEVIAKSLPQSQKDLTYIQIHINKCKNL